jgi:quinol monooxygenase YgiN
MFYHIVMMQLNADADAEFHRQVESFSRRIRHECDGVLHYDYCRNIAGRGKGYEHVIVSVFESAAAHDRYQVSPAHQAMKAYVMPFVADLVVCDNDLPHPAAILRAPA